MSNFCCDRKSSLRALNETNSRNFWPKISFDIFGKLKHGTKVHDLYFSFNCRARGQRNKGGMKSGSKFLYRRIFYDVTLPRQLKNWSIMAVQGVIAGDHFYYKRERNIVLQPE